MKLKQLLQDFLFIFNVGVVKTSHPAFIGKNFKYKIPLTDFALVSKNTALSRNKKSVDPKKLPFPQESELPKTTLLNWKPEEDQMRIINSAQDFRADISSSFYAQKFRTKESGQKSVNAGRSFWRIETMKQVRQAIPGIFSGKVLEVGAGTSIVSCMISKFKEVTHVSSLDYDSYSAEKLMPLVQWSLDAETSKMTRVIGSYNSMKCADGEFDAIVAVGSMHHSEDIIATMKECFRALKPGGHFIISDYVMTGSMTQEEYWAIMDKPVNEEGAEQLLSGVDRSKIQTNRTISEHARPAYVYQNAAFTAGFNISMHLFDATTDSGGKLARLWRKINSSIKGQKIFESHSQKRELGYDCFGNVRAHSVNNEVNYPYYADGVPSLLALALFGDSAGKPVYDNMVLILEKPHSEGLKIPYRYRNGKLYHFEADLRNIEMH